MNIHELRVTIENTEGFKSFIKRFPKAYLCAGFFIIPLGFESKDSERQEHLDYYIPSTGEIASFNDHGEFKVEGQGVPKVMDPLSGVSLVTNEVESLVSDELSSRGVTSTINKMIIIVYSYNNRTIWSVTVMLSNYDFVKIKILDDKKEISDFEKINLMSLVNIKKSGDKLEVDSSKDGSVNETS
ncbi:hypothetical protein COU61_01970 [Candidatus Pacearchaeota archaeon CG10_big_fil_rev_8_21_14_0_10_35_13]|nr:MAG: hypothetical protein COU61_01970 [Candidatus Pacearchaeota archaeon CG10_big_fil_rev_8_21_14_0_10_35_13]